MSSLPHLPGHIRPTDAKEQIRDRTNGTGTLRYSDIFLAMYSDNGMSCLHRNHSHVLVYMYSGELEINERNRITRLHRGTVPSSARISEYS